MNNINSDVKDVLVSKINKFHLVENHSWAPLILFILGALVHSGKYASRAFIVQFLEKLGYEKRETSTPIILALNHLSAKGFVEKSYINPCFPIEIIGPTRVHNSPIHSFYRITKEGLARAKLYAEELETTHKI